MASRSSSSSEQQGLVLGIDIGTSSIRTSLFDHLGKRILPSTFQKSYSLHLTSDGGAELPTEVLWKNFVHCLTQTLHFRRKSSGLSKLPILGAGTSCFWHSFTGILKNGKATPIYTWADSRCREDSRILREKFDEEKIHAETGCMLRSAFWPAKLRWLRRTHPKIFSQVVRWVSPADWIYSKTCHEGPMSFSMASGSGLFNLKNHRWNPTLLRELKIGEKTLGPVSDEPHRTHHIFSRKFPELAETPWFPAIGDGASSNLGSGAVQPGTAAINYGTSAALRIVKSGTHHRVPFGLFCYRIDQNRCLIGGAISNAGNLRAWCLRELRLPDDPVQIQKALKKRNSATNPLVVLPFWTTERSPTWPEELTGTIMGIQQSTSALELLQAIGDASYHRLAQIAERVETLTPKKLKLVVSGGIQKSPFLLKRLANILNRPVYASSEPEASIRGAAVFVLEKLGYPISPVQTGKAIHPDPSLARSLAQIRRSQELLEKHLSTFK